MEELYTVTEVAKRLRVGKRAAYDLMASGELPFVQITVRRRVVSDSALQKFVKAREVSE